MDGETKEIWWGKTSRGYDVFGPDKDGDVSVESDVETNIIWLTREDVTQLLARWPARHDARLIDAEHDAALAGGDGPEARDRREEDRWGREEAAERRRDRGT